MTAVIILAAGTSSRLGHPKQLLPFQDQSLLKHAIKAALDSGVEPVVVVIRSNEKEIHSHIEDEPISIVLNEDYMQGIASSIKAGLGYILEAHKECDSVILMVCDQPHVNPALLKNLVTTKQETNKPIVACSYKNTIGVPALFDKKFFPELLSLNGEEGGKKVLLHHENEVAAIAFPKGEIDIDTPADYDALKK